MSAPAVRPEGTYNISVGYLRAFVTLLVLAHHSFLAYCSFTPPPPASLVSKPRWWEAFPVVDSAHWPGFDVVVGFNDIYFMSLMFFLSGLFVWKSLVRKGAGRFASDRWRRLGVPFFAAVAIVSPLAYAAAYAQGSAHPSMGGFVAQWLSLGEWPSGPAWFVWMLLVFDWIAAAMLWMWPRWGERLGRMASEADRHPGAYFWRVAGVCSVAYVPLAVTVGPASWTGWNPWVLQSSRPFLYFTWFMAGAAVGAGGLGRGLLAPDGRLARQWWLWAIRALGAFGVATAIAPMALSAHSFPHVWAAVGGLAFVLSCAASCFCLLSLFTRFVKTRRRAFDSLTANAYGMYLVHYAFVAWLQYALLRIALPGIAKGVIVLAGAVMLSWAATAALRRIPAVGRAI